MLVKLAALVIDKVGVCTGFGVILIVVSLVGRPIESQLNRERSLQLERVAEQERNAAEEQYQATRSQLNEKLRQRWSEYDRQWAALKEEQIRLWLEAEKLKAERGKSESVQPAGGVNDRTSLSAIRSRWDIADVRLQYERDAFQQVSRDTLYELERSANNHRLKMLALSVNDIARREEIAYQSRTWSRLFLLSTFLGAFLLSFRAFYWAKAKFDELKLTADGPPADGNGAGI